MSKKYYITTTIPYLNAPPHIGHAYEFLLADVIARWHRFLGEDVFFLTGSDEHGMKIEDAAKKNNLTAKEHVDKTVLYFKELCNDWLISYDRFIRTTEVEHKKIAADLFEKVRKNNDIYLGNYEGKYCVNCERFYLERDLEEKILCPVHKKEIIEIKEPSYFFKMSSYEEKLKNHFLENSDFIEPKHKIEEMLNRMKDGLEDLSVSREALKWGIPLTHDPSHVIYVWFDALLNYVTGVSDSKEQFEKYWSPDLQILGKDVAWFHAVIWPTMLFALDLPLPKKLLIHGFINDEQGRKMSKTLGNVVDPIKISKKYDIDAIRYYLIREIPETEDGNFSEEDLIERLNNELANDLGNLVHRILSMTSKYFDSIVPNNTFDTELGKELNLEKIKKSMEELKLGNSLTEIMSFAKACNKYINDKEPWKVESKEEREKIMYSLLDSLRVIANLTNSFIPKSSKKISEMLNTPLGNIEECKFGLLKSGTKLNPGEILFKKTEYAEPMFDPIKYFKEKGEKIPSVILEINGLKIQKRSMQLERMKKELIEKLDINELKNSSLVKEYYELKKTTDLLDEEPSPVNLFNIVEKSKRLPNINTATDCYNLVSLETGIVMGAYDKREIKGNVNLRRANGLELFIPVGSIKKIPIKKDELVYVDDDNKVITKLITKQSEFVKVGLHTKDIIVCIQGNKEISLEELTKIAKKTAELIVSINGGTYRIVEPEN